MQYVTWEHYSSLFGKIEDEQEFERFLARAQNKMDMITHLRVRRFEESYREDTATDYQRQIHEQIENTLCEMLDLMRIQETSGMGDGISSVSNDGYSETYRVTTRKEKEEQLRQVLASGLSGTGLMGAL